MSYRNVSMSLFPIFLLISMSARISLSLLAFFFRRNAFEWRRCESHWCSGMLFSSVKLNKLARKIFEDGKKCERKKKGKEWTWMIEVSEEDEKGQKKAQSDLLHRMCCFEMYFSTRYRESHFSIFFASAQDVNVMNMLMLISWKGSTLLKTHPSCSTVAYIFYAHKHFICDVACYLGKLFLLQIILIKKVCIIKTNNCERYSQRETKVSSWCENNQSKCLRVSYIYQVLCQQQHQVHWKFMSFLIIITLWCSLCGDELRYEWHLSFLPNLSCSLFFVKRIKNRNQTIRNLSTLLIFRFSSFFFRSFDANGKKVLELNNSPETIEWFSFDFDVPSLILVYALDMQTFMKFMSRNAGWRAVELIEEFHNFYIIKIISLSRCDTFKSTKCDNVQWKKIFYICKQDEFLYIHKFFSMIYSGEFWLILKC